VRLRNGLHISEKRRISSTQLGNRIPPRPARSLFTIPTDLHRLTTKQISYKSLEEIKWFALVHINGLLYILLVFFETT
jgi:hypothetical protein